LGTRFWTGFNLLRTGSRDGLLWTRKWTFRLHNGINFWPRKQLPASQGFWTIKLGHGTKEPDSYSGCYNPGIEFPLSVGQDDTWIPEKSGALTKIWTILQNTPGTSRIKPNP
jgi:hypothetical protein